MSDDTDFVTLYDELGLDAACALPQFKRAYRRRVTQLHPDHQGGPGDMPRLQRLNRMYEAALEFHRVHGRLPGASPSREPGAPPREAANDDTLVQEYSFEVTGTDAAPVTGFPRRRRYLLWLALVAVLLYWWGAQKSATPSLDPAGPGDAVPPGFGAPALASAITVGMDEKQVRRILGFPDTEHGSRWEYGPSWVQFQCGQVVGWYSSPLKPLQVDETSAGRITAPHC